MVLTDSCGEYCTWQVMEEYVPKEQLLKYKNEFNQKDPDSTGVISLENVSHIFKKFYGSTYSCLQLKSLLQKITECDLCYASNDNFVDFSEFLALITSVAKVIIKLHNSIFAFLFFFYYFRIAYQRTKY